jgi:hypothetical protein
MPETRKSGGQSGYPTLAKPEWVVRLPKPSPAISTFAAMALHPLPFSPNRGQTPTQVRTR